MSKEKTPNRLPTASPDLIASMGSNHLHDQSRLIVRFNGRLDEATFRHAVELSLLVDPVLACRFVRSSIRPYWQRCGDIENVFEFGLVDESGDGAIKDFLLAPFDPFSSPQIRVALFRSRTDVLCIKMNHLIADGGASIEYLCALSKLYRQLKKNPTYQPKNNLSGCRNSYQVLRHISPLKILESCLQMPMSKSTWNFPDYSAAGVMPQIFIRRISSNQLKKIRNYAKASKATVGDVLLAAVYRGLFEVLDPPENVPLTMLVPVNLRRYIPNQTSDGICSLTGGYFTQITRRKAEPFHTTLIRVHDAMDRERAKQGMFGQMFLMELMFAPGYFIPRLLNPFFSSSLVMPTLSNFGVMDPKNADFGVEVQEVLPIGPLTHPPEFIVGASSFRNELTFTVTAAGSEAYRESVDSFLDHLVSELSNLK